MAEKDDKTPKAKTSGGLRVARRFTQPGAQGFDTFKFVKRTSVIRNPSGDAVFEMNDVEVPEGWSQVATDIMAQKYFRKAGVPQPDGSTGAETSAKQSINRLTDCWRKWGERYGYFASETDAENFQQELNYMLAGQMAAPNSPQWFNTGLYESYGIEGPPQGHFYAEPETGAIKESESAYARPAPHACFILSVKDDLVNPGGIMDLWTREARIFKYGSGVGTNFSTIRAENEGLSGGGQSSGLMSFLKIGDRAAGAIKSGGTTRRAAKMVILDIDHPEIEGFIDWKVNEEKKVAALIEAGYSSDYEGEAYRTVSGQNSNNSVRIPQSFFEALQADGEWETRARTTGEAMNTYKARELWERIAKAAHACADPGLQFHTTINDWHTCPNDGEIRGSNPCSEYMFLDNTACNLASLNLRKFFDEDTLEFDVESFEHAARLWTIVLEISVLMAQFPSREVAELSYKFRTLGLGYANLGSMLMVAGIPYDSEQGRAIAGAVTALLTGTAYATSAELARELGAFEGYERNKEEMLRVMRNHRYAAYNATDAYEDLSIKPQGIDQKVCPQYLLKAACDVWDKALQLGQQYGYRNAQATVLAPTGTIGLLMDCDTTGVEPDFALVKFKKLSGGGYFKIINQSIPPSLRNLGYSDKEIEEITNYAKGRGSLKGAPYINEESLKAKGFTDKDLENIEGGLHSAFDINFVFNVYTLGEETMQRLGFAPEQYRDPGFSLLGALGFTPKQIQAANEYVCGTMTIEGAPYLKKEHYPVFDCANKCGVKGERFIHAHGHIKMMAAAQPFISGAISKTINLPHEATWEEIEESHMLSWELGLKALSIYRDGSKLSQPLSTKGKKDDAKDEETETAATADAAPPVRPALELNKEEALELVRNMLAHSDDSQFKGALRRIVNRRPLPQKRKGVTWKNKVGAQTIFLRTGEYEDGQLGEIFIDIHREGAFLRSMLNCFAISVSIGLQYGVPLEEFVDKFAFTRFDPAGAVDHPNLKYATSMLDYVFRVLAYEYLDREDLVQNPDPAETAAPGKTGAPQTADESGKIKLESKNFDLVIDAPQKKQPEAPAPKGETPNGKRRNGSSGTNGTHHTPRANEARAALHTETAVAPDASNRMLSDLMGDAPACDVCGHITVRNGTCYKCMNCGHSMGCS